MASWTMEGRTCLITGATSGIGEETALAVAKAGGRVVLLARSAERAAHSKQRIDRESGGPEVAIVHGDLGSLDSTRRAAQDFLDRFDALHLLINNAGVIHMSRTTTEDGFETTMAVNHLAPFLLTNLLLERLIASAPARIVNVASDAHRFAGGGVDLADLQSEKSYSAFKTYGRSKAANILFTVELARRLEGTGVAANAVHPGAVATRLGHNNGRFSHVVTSLLKPFFRTPEKGAATSIRVALAPELDDVSGRYFVNERERAPSAHAMDLALAGGLWKQSCALTGVAD